ncbi:MAG: histidine kinase [Bacteroidia bacterium]|nr:histidine kinase [Bacteroidia bacterium]
MKKGFKKIFLVSLFSFLKFIYYGQTCKESQDVKIHLERNFEAKTFDSIEHFLKKIPKDKSICYQEYLLFKIRYLLETKAFDSVSVLFEKLNKSLTENNNNTKWIKTQEIYLKGRYYYGKSYNDSASYYFLRSLDFAKAQKDTTLQIKSLNSLSNVFANLYQYDKSIDYASAGLNLCRKKNEKASEILLLGNLISYYGKYYLKTGKKIMLDSAESVSKILVREAKKQNNIYGLLKGYSGLGSCYFQYEDYKKTLAYSDSIIFIAKSGKFPKQMLQAYGNICDSYLALGKFTLAKTAADSALMYALKQRDKIAISEVYYKMYDCENELKNYEGALEYYKKYSTAKDSANADEQFSIVNELEQKYNKFENEKIIDDLIKQKEISGLRIKILIVGSALIFILIIFIVFIFRQRNLKQKHMLLETEQRLNRARINPHFFFNSITTLQGIALKENDGKKIFSNLFVFSKLMRETLESTYSDLVSIKREIVFLENYISLQKLNNQNKFLFEINISDQIDEENILIPAMIIQPFIENTIEHGFSELKTGGLISLSFDILDNELLITIRDNGKGFQNSGSKKQNHTSRAMQITTDRLNLINKLHNSNARFLLSSNSPVGTLAEIFLPLDLKNESTGN